MRYVEIITTRENVPDSWSIIFKGTCEVCGSIYSIEFPVMSLKTGKLEIEEKLPKMIEHFNTTHIREVHKDTSDIIHEHNKELLKLC